MLTLSFFENAQSFPSARQFRDVVEAAASAGRLRDLRLAARELDAMTVALTQDQRDGLDALLKSRLGVDAEAERVTTKDEVAAVIRRGSIASAKERQRIEGYLDYLIASGGDPSEMQAVEDLLSKE